MKWNVAEETLACKIPVRWHFGSEMSRAEAALQATTFLRGGRRAF